MTAQALRSRNWFGRKWLRKPQASYGWDWQDSLPNIGIGRDVRLSFVIAAVVMATGWLLALLLPHMQYAHPGMAYSSSLRFIHQYLN